ncbi:MAG: hypothetical protein U9N04_04535 [Patescibacteria group bacterium]|nr:hypothetical protein [Patescibacteria group bacterium]
MNSPTDKEKIEKLRNLYNKFYSKVVVLKKRQLELLERAKKLVEEKKMREIRDRIKK